jgi:hypothetical protein
LIIGIEIKNGSSEQTYVKMLHEIERYLIHTCLLLVIRIPYKIVHPFVRDIDSLIQRIEWITKKANLLTSGQQPGHECQWCVDSQRPSSTANIDTSFYTDTLEVVKKTIDILEKEFRRQNIVEKSNEIFGQQRHTEITGDSIGYEYNGNGDAREKIFNVGISDNGNGNEKDERGSKKRIKDLKSDMRGVSII